MPFGLTNALAIFQSFINHVFWEFLNIFCIVYIDNILIFSDSKKKHTRHLRAILKKLAKAGLFIKEEKCNFFTTSTFFLSFIVSPKGLSIDSTKVATILD